MDDFGRRTLSPQRISQHGSRGDKIRGGNLFVDHFGWLEEGNDA